MRKLALGALLIGTLTFALAQKTQTVYINGQPVQAISVTIGGKAYTQILTSDLIKTGALTQGGNTTVTSIQGCKGQTLFNGVLRVTLLEAGEKKDKYDKIYYAVRFKIANGTNKEISNLPSDANFNYNYIYVASKEGQAQQLGTWDEKESPNRSLIQGGMTYVTLSIDASRMPQFKVSRILWRPDPKDIDTSLPWAKLKNMEFALDCPQK